MADESLAWIIVIVIVILVGVVHIVRCLKYFDATSELQASRGSLRIMRTLHVPTATQPYIISSQNLQNDIENGLNSPENVNNTSEDINRNYCLESKDNCDPPSYEEVMAQDLQRRLNQSISEASVRC